MKDKSFWSSRFAPSYTPMEMLDLGVFMDCHYTFVITDIPSKYTEHKNAIPRNKEPDAKLNKFGVKSRQSLKVWQENGWTTKDSPLGWWEWYIKYFEGRRLGEEDDWQINRWRSFCARHQGQIDASGNKDKLSERVKQRQGLLQWGWDSTISYTKANRTRNLKRLIEGNSNIILEEDLSIDEVSAESLYLPSVDW